MKEILIILLNLIFLLIVWVILNYKIKKNSIPSRLEEYTREVERLIVELNRAVDDVVSVSEDRIKQLKSVIKKAEKLLKKIEEKESKGLLNISDEAGDAVFSDSTDHSKTGYAGDTGENRKRGYITEGSNNSSNVLEEDIHRDDKKSKDKIKKNVSESINTDQYEVKDGVGATGNARVSKNKYVQDENKSLAEKTAHLFSMGYTREEVAKILGVTIGEVEFLRSLGSLGIQRGIRKK